MPKLLFKPIEHKIGENRETFITGEKKGEPVLCIKCNDEAAFIIKQMYPEHKPRKEIIPLVIAKFGCTEEEATEAVEGVIKTLSALNKGKTQEGGLTSSE